ncbi:MAG: hypothetical protein WB808_06700 [Candidatus Dormiibacterota bacterium]
MKPNPLAEKWWSAHERETEALSEDLSRTRRHLPSGAELPNHPVDRYPPKEVEFVALAHPSPLLVQNGYLAVEFPKAEQEGTF